MWLIGDEMIMSSKLFINFGDLLWQCMVEGEWIEYKVGWNLDVIICMLCVFVNDFENLGGGYVVIGQDCDVDGCFIFLFVGLFVELLDRIQCELFVYCQLIQLFYFLVLSVEVIEGCNLIVLQVLGGQMCFYKVLEVVIVSKKMWCYYICCYSSMVEVKGDSEQEFLSFVVKVLFDDCFNQFVSVDDLFRFLMQGFLEEIGSVFVGDVLGFFVEVLGWQMNVVGGFSELLWFKNVGLLFFNEMLEWFFFGVQIDVVWFFEGVGGDCFDEKIFKGLLV